MDSRPPLLLLAASLLLLGGCVRRGPALPDGVALSLATTPDPPVVGAARVRVTLTQDGKPLTGASVTLEGNMTHPGMSPVDAPAPEGPPGEYAAPNFDFSMAGDWVMTVKVTDAGRHFEADQPLSVRQ